MTRMGKSIPEPKTVTSTLSAASGSKKTASNTATGGSNSALKKVYCTPKITFVGETLFLYLVAFFCTHSHTAYAYL